MKPTWVEIPAGSFLMGGVPDDKFVSAVELPRHEVTIARPFALGVFPVTRGEWFERRFRMRIYPSPESISTKSRYS